jgi:hypothetical protein
MEGIKIWLLISDQWPMGSGQYSAAEVPHRFLLPLSRDSLQIPPP